MTEHRNPLMDRPRQGGAAPSFVSSNGEQVPTDIYAYCAHLNARERRKGIWVVIQTGDRRTIDWRSEIASEDWLREHGMAPKIARAA